MSLETVTYISDFNTANPPDGDPAAQGAAHIRNVKSGVRNTFPNANGAVTSTHVQLSNPILQATPLANTLPYYNTNSTATTINFTTVGQALVSAANTAVALSSIGADAKYLPFTGGTLTGNLTAPTVYHDATFVSYLASGNPVISFDTGDYMSYDRTNNAFNFVSNSTVRATIDNTGRITMTAYTITSDDRLKSNVQTIQNPLGILNQINGVSFVYNDTGRQSMGVIAQNVQQVLPSLVSTNADGFLSVDYAAFTGPLIEASKSLKGMVDALTQRVAALEATVAALEAKANGGA